MTAVVKKNPTSSANESKTEFQYDGYSRLRVSKEYTWNGTAWVVLAANSEKHRIYDGMDVVQERDENNAVLATYTRDGNIGGILSKRDDNGDDYFFHYDGSGNVIGLTDENEDSVAEYAYDAYGNLLSSSGTQANSNNYRYSTKEHFGSIGLYNYGYRFYNPGLGRWINRDPLEEEGGLNLYAMVENNPSNDVDSYGLAPQYKKVLPEAKAALDRLRKAMPGWDVTRAYYPSGGNSGTTHDIQPSGGSVGFDLSVRGHDSAQILRMLQILPDYGFVGWYRYWFNKDGTSNFHIHIIYAYSALDHSGRNPGSSAGRQVDSWLNRGDGLRGSRYYYKGKYNNEKAVFPWTQKQLDNIRKGHKKSNSKCPL